MPHLPERLFSTVSRLLIDIHTHTFPKSDDSLLSPDQLINEAKRVGLDGICLTDHDGFWNPASVTELGREYDFPIYPGCEVTEELIFQMKSGRFQPVVMEQRQSLAKGVQ